MRDTWYTPHRDARFSTLPENIFSRVNRIYSDRIFLTDAKEENEEQSIESKMDENVKKGDEYGLTMAGGKMSIFISRK